MAERKRTPVDEMWLVCVADDLRDMGCDEDFIQATIDELRAGGDVTVTVSNPGSAFRGKQKTFKRKAKP